MKNLKDIALEFIDNISEGILDDIDTALETADDYMYEKQLTKWSKNSKTPAHWWKKRVGYTLQGDYKITDIDDEYDGPKIRLVKGDVTICNTNL